MAKLTGLKQASERNSSVAAGETCASPATNYGEEERGRASGRESSNSNRGRVAFNYPFPKTDMTTK